MKIFLLLPFDSHIVQWLVAFVVVIAISNSKVIANSELCFAESSNAKSFQYSGPAADALVLFVPLDACSQSRNLAGRNLSTVVTQHDNVRFVTLTLEQSLSLRISRSALGVSHPVNDDFVVSFQRRCNANSMCSNDFSLMMHVFKSNQSKQAVLAQISHGDTQEPIVTISAVQSQSSGDLNLVLLPSNDPAKSIFFHAGIGNFNHWIFVGIVYDSNQKFIQVFKRDGQSLTKVDNFDLTWQDSSVTLSLGHNLYPGDLLSSTLFFNKALTGEEITDIDALLHRRFRDKQAEMSRNSSYVKKRRLGSAHVTIDCSKISQKYSGPAAQRLIAMIPLDKCSQWKNLAASQVKPTFLFKGLQLASGSPGPFEFFDSSMEMTGRIPGERRQADSFPLVYSSGMDRFDSRGVGFTLAVFVLVPEKAKRSPVNVVELFERQSGTSVVKFSVETYSKAVVTVLDEPVLSFYLHEQGEQWQMLILCYDRGEDLLEVRRETGDTASEAFDIGLPDFEGLDIVLRIGGDMEPSDRIGCLLAFNRPLDTVESTQLLAACRRRLLPGTDSQPNPPMDLVTLEKLGLTQGLIGIWPMDTTHGLLEAYNRKMQLLRLSPFARPLGEGQGFSKVSSDYENVLDYLVEYDLGQGLGSMSLAFFFSVRRESGGELFALGTQSGQRRRRQLTAEFYLREVSLSTARKGERPAKIQVNTLPGNWAFLALTLTEAKRATVYNTNREHQSYHLDDVDLSDGSVVISLGKIEPGETMRCVFLWQRVVAPELLLDVMPQYCGYDLREGKILETAESEGPIAAYEFLTTHAVPNYAYGNSETGNIYEDDNGVVAEYVPGTNSTNVVTTEVIPIDNTPLPTLWTEKETESTTILNLPQQINFQPIKEERNVTSQQTLAQRNSAGEASSSMMLELSVVSLAAHLFSIFLCNALFSLPAAS